MSSTESLPVINPPNRSLNFAFASGPASDSREPVTCSTRPLFAANNLNPAGNCSAAALVRAVAGVGELLIALMGTAAAIGRLGKFVAAMGCVPSRDETEDRRLIWATFERGNVRSPRTSL